MTPQQKAWQEYWKNFQESFPDVAQKIEDESLFMTMKYVFLTAFLKGAEYEPR
jgi:hypothetical protein